MIEITYFKNNIFRYPDFEVEKQLEDEYGRINEGSILNINHCCVGYRKI